MKTIGMPKKEKNTQTDSDNFINKALSKMSKEQIKNLDKVNPSGTRHIFRGGKCIARIHS